MITYGYDCEITDLLVLEIRLHLDRVNYNSDTITTNKPRKTHTIRRAVQATPSI